MGTRRKDMGDNGCEDFFEVDNVRTCITRIWDGAWDEDYDPEGISVEEVSLLYNKNASIQA